VRLLPKNASDEDLLRLCREWIELVAAGRLQEALELLWVPPSYDPSQRWTADSLRRYVENYGSWEPTSDGSTWRISSIAAAKAPAGRDRFVPRADVVRFSSNPQAGSVELDLPLNGEWSDLTAQFEFAPVGAGVAVSLYDLHVL
jgi:hypothetical protein